MTVDKSTLLSVLGALGGRKFLLALVGLAGVWFGKRFGVDPDQSANALWLLAAAILGITAQDVATKGASSTSHAALNGSPGAVQPLAPRPENKFPVPFVLLPLLLLFMSGCVSGTPARKHAEDEVVKRYEQANVNEEAANNGQENALRSAVEKRLNLELQLAVRDVRNQAKLDPLKYPPDDAAAEIARLYSIHNLKLAQFAKGQADLRAARQKNQDTNVAGARRIYSALKQNDAAPPLNLTGAVESIVGTPPPNATLITP